MSRANSDADVDAILLVIYDPDLRPIEIREVPMQAVREYLGATQSVARRWGRMRARALYTRGIVRWGLSGTASFAATEAPAAGSKIFMDPVAVALGADDRSPE